MELFSKALNLAVGQKRRLPEAVPGKRLGLTAWLIDRLPSRSERPRLALVERIVLAPKQALALIEADGQRVLVATSSDGAAVFFPLTHHPDSYRSSLLQTATERERL